MRKVKKMALLLLCGIAGFFGMKKDVIADMGVDGYYLYEACDGEVVFVENIKDKVTHYIFPERSYDDLANKVEITSEDMEYLIEHYAAIHPDTALKGCAKAFIKASNDTGLDPLFFFALCGIESGWGTNKTHIELNNPYSFGMYGDGSHGGYSLGETFSEGIINGANYIYENYYKKGQKTLYDMNHVEGHSYCAGDSNWEYMVGSQMVFLHELLDNR